MILPFGLDPLTAGYMAVVILLAAFVRGYSGFGFPALVVAAGSLVMNPLLLVPLVVVADLILSAQMAPSARGHVRWRVALVMSAGALVGVPLGLWVFAALPVDVVRGVLAGIVTLACLAMLTGWTLPGRFGTPAALGTGFLSGMANATGVGGLPVVVLVAALNLPPAAFRATLLAYFVVLDIFTAVGFGVAGRLDGDMLRAMLMTLPLFLGGVWLGGRRFVNADPATFRKVAIAVLMVLALLGLAKALL